MERHRRQARELFVDGIIPPPRRSLVYLAGLLAGLLLLLAMPLAYLGLITIGGYGIYYHTTEHLRPLLSLGESNQFLLLAFGIGLYVLPLIGGITVLLFLIKPIFAPASQKPATFILRPESEPLLVAFVEEICNRMNVPEPHSIELSTDLSASASYRGGIRGVIQHDLVLTIGLPLVVGLDVRQFAGVIAHELGHFNQTISMRLSYFVRRTQAWLNRVAFERDAWDQSLEDWNENHETGLFTFTLVLLVQTGVGLGRLILAGLANGSQLGISLMLRQMEFNADRCGIRMSGSAAYETLMLQLAVLAKAMDTMQRDMRQTLKSNGKVPSNIAALLSHYSDSLSESVRTQWEGKQGLIRTRWFDTHPSIADRIREARQLNAPGMINETKRAIDLFEDFDIPAQQVTLTYYQNLFRQEIPPEVLYEVEVKVDAIHRPENPAELTDRFFFNCLEWHRPFAPPEQLPGTVSLETLRTLPERVARLSAVESDIAQVLDLLNHTRSEAVQTRKNWLLTSVRIGIDDRPDLEPLTAALKAAEKTHSTAHQKLASAWKQLEERVRWGIAALRVEVIRESMPEAKKLARQLTAVQVALNELQTPFELLAGLKVNLQDLEWLLAAEATEQANRFSRTQLLGIMGECRHATLALEDQLANIPYLFTQSSANESLRNHLSDGLTPLIIGDATTVFQRGQALAEAVVNYHDALAATLAQIIESVEQQVAQILRATE